MNINHIVNVFKKMWPYGQFLNFVPEEVDHAKIFHRFATIQKLALMGLIGMSEYLNSNREVWIGIKS